MYTGEVQAYWKDTWIETLKHRPAFGTKPYASTFDPDGKEKRIAKILDPTHKESNFFDEDWRFQSKDHFKLFLYVVADIIQSYNMMRGQLEPSLLTRNDFDWGTMTEGCWKGRRYCKLKSSHLGQKQKHLTLSNYTRTDTTAKSNYLPLVQMTDEWYDDFNIVHRWFHHILPPESENQTGKPIRIFQYMANKNQITVSVEYLIYSFTSCPAVLYSILFYSILVSNYNYFFFRLFFTN